MKAIIFLFIIGLICLLGFFGNQVSRKFEVDEQFAMMDSQEDEHRIIHRSDELELQVLLWVGGVIIGFGGGAFLTVRKLQQTR